MMKLKTVLRSKMKAARKRGLLWVRMLDLLRLFLTSERRALLWTRVVHAREVHQTTPYTCEERYPELFDLAAGLAPEASRILSFGCSTGEELIALRRRFPDADIVGAEINSRSRRIAARRVVGDSRTKVIGPDSVDGMFDLIFALAVLQREPHKIDELGVQDLSAHYPFERFDAAVRSLAGGLRTGGLLCVIYAHYRIEDSSVARQLEPIAASALMGEPIFGRDGRRLVGPIAHTIFRMRREDDR